MLDPHSPYVRAARASMLVLQERHDEALAEFDAVLEALPRHARSLAARGALRVRMGKPEEALRDLDAALEIDPRNATALLWRGAAKLRRSEPEAALADFDAVAGRDADAAGPPVAQFRAEALLALGRAEEALGDLEARRRPRSTPRCSRSGARRGWSSAARARRSPTPSTRSSST